MKRASFVIFLLAAVAVVAAGVYLKETFIEPGRDERPAAQVQTEHQVARGAYLARAGNCMACHTTRGGEPYAGGRAIATPFGNIYASNLTPHREAGIGTWTADDFWRALHNGKGRDGRFLYPAFPYTEYTKVTREDADALFAFLRTLPPSSRTNRAPELDFPFNQRPLLAFWRALYFRPGTFEPVGERTAQWNRGAYLVQGLGHCATCHTSRDALGGSRRSATFEGGMLRGLEWFAPPLAGQSGTGPGAWSVPELASFLHTGATDAGTALGPMAEVVAGSLQHLNDGDVHAMAEYLQSLPARPAAAPVATTTAADRNILEKGAALYDQHCVACHGANGEGVRGMYPALAGNRSLAGSSPVNGIRVVLSGGYAPTTAGNPRPFGMPPFGAVLDDNDIAALMSFVQTSWGNRGGMVSAIEVARYRGAPLE